MAVRITRDGWVYNGSTLVGAVKRDGRSWRAYVQMADSLAMRSVGTFTIKREAVTEVVIMREV